MKGKLLEAITEEAELNGLNDSEIQALVSMIDDLFDTAVDNAEANQ